MIGTKLYTEVVDSSNGVVGKRSNSSEGEAASDPGVVGSENADISNDNRG
jgi:hypothetical protein